MSEKVTTLDDLWPQCAEHLRPALAFGRDLYSLEDVREAIEEGRAHLWPMGAEGTIVSQIREFPNGQRIVNFWLAGGTLRALVAAEPIVANWARGQGCTAAQITGRKGWVKALPHYEHVANVLWRPLREDA